MQDPKDRPVEDIIRTIDQNSQGPTADTRIQIEEILDPKDRPAEGT